MKTNFKFTGTNMAAAILLIAYFFTWVNGTLVTMSGYTLTTTAISPGMLTYAFDGISRVMMLILVVLPLSGALILFQNVTNDKRFAKYFKAAHVLPAIILIAIIAGAYFKMQSNVNTANAQLGAFSQYMPKIQTPGLFDVMGFGVYISFAASIFLFLMGIGKIKDKEYFVKPNEDTENNSQIN